MPAHEYDTPNDIEYKYDIEQNGVVARDERGGDGGSGEHHGEGQAGCVCVDAAPQGVVEIVRNADGEPFVLEILHDLSDLGGRGRAEFRDGKARAQGEVHDVSGLDVAEEEFFGELSQGADDVEIWVEILDDAFDIDECAPGIGEFGGNLDGEFLSGGDEFGRESGDVDFFEGVDAVLLQDV